MNQEELSHMRHSLAHLLAAAVMELWPDTKRTIGPAIDNGFYFDFEFSQPITPEDLPKIEKKMRQILPTWTSFERHELSPEDAKKEYPGNEFKHELIDEFSGEGQSLSFYKSGDYWDLCRGGHVENMKADIDPKSFKLHKIAGAYWRGSEKNPQLTRIYGLAFETEQELADYLAMMAEAEKRDHRKLGKELEIFMLSEEVGAGLPLWLPNGAIIVEELEKLAKQVEFDGGYSRVRTPHITKGTLYHKSGHLPYYAETMFPPMVMDNEEYYLKPMNCPHHHLIYGNKTRSYRDLPIRLAEYGHCYRYEDSGALFGLMRVRSLCMNDAHIYCRPDQFESEFIKVMELYKNYSKIFGIKKMVMRLSLHDKEGLGKKYVNEPELWIQTEEQVRQAMLKTGIEFVEAPGEAAFYGPKIDVEVWSAIGREFTLATNQLDFAVPKRFDLTYVDSDGQEKTPLCVHRAPLGTHERFVGFLIEHFAGAFPTWLSPVQAIVLPVSDKFLDYAKEVEAALKAANVRAETDDSAESLGKKIRGAEKRKIPWLLVVGEAEVAARTVAARSTHTKKQENFALDTFVKQIAHEIADRALPPEPEEAA
ncbi:MAG: threonine--tRNA ligase [Candidatus Gracilibacteria bacterium]|jgi:threonyl-tRNA synthetase